MASEQKPASTPGHKHLQQLTLSQFFESPPQKKQRRPTTVENELCGDHAVLSQPDRKSDSEHDFSFVQPKQELDVAKDVGIGHINELDSVTVKDHVTDGANATLSMGPHGIDIADVLVQPNDEITPEVMMRLINNREPEANFKFPSKQYKDTIEKTGVKLRRCSRVWLNTHDFICYSKSTDGLFCLSCVLFPVSAYRGKRAEKIISSPYRNWKDAKLDLQRHANLQYHRHSKTRMDSFMARMNNPSLIIGNKLSLECQKQVSKNRTFLTSIIKCIELCGRQGLGLRGHRDDSTSKACNQGNFKALLDL